MMMDFEYIVPKNLGEALFLLSQHKDEGKAIAGGQSLLILMRQGLVNPKVLIDIKGLSSLDYIKANKEGLRIGALTSHRAIETSPVVRNGFSVLAEMERKLATVQTRNYGTIGGNLCHADPTGDPAPVFIALNAIMTIAGPAGERTIGIENFYQGYFRTALEYGELLIEITVPQPPPGTGTAYSKFSLLYGDYAIASAAVSVNLGQKGEICRDARIVLGAVSTVPMRARQAEKVFVGKKLSEAVIEEGSRLAATESEPISDMNASEDYRRDLVRTLVKRMTREALEKAQSAQ